MTDQPGDLVEDIEMIYFKDLVTYAEFVANTPDRGAVPITRSRARCAVGNPEADPDDLALITMLDRNHKVIAYFGFLPAKARLNGKVIKVNWGCTAFVDDRLRRSGLTKIAMASLKKKNMIICATGNSLDADRMYRFLKFEEASGFNGWIVKTLPFRPFLILRKILNKAGIRQKFLSSERPKRFPKISAFLFGRNYELVEHEGDLPESCAAILGSGERDGHIRSPATIRWMLSSPWWPADPVLNEVEKKYFFSWTGKKLRYRVFELKNRKTRDTVACIILSEVRESISKLKLLDCSVIDPRLKQLVPVLVLEVALRQKVDQILISPEFCRAKFVSLLCRLLGRKQIETYFTYAPDQTDASKIVSFPHNLTDGDTPFW